MKYFGCKIKHKIKFNTLINLFTQIPQAKKLSWNLIEIEGSADLSELKISMKYLTDECNKNNMGKKISYEFFVEIVNRLESLDNLLIIGGNVDNRIIDVTDDLSIYQNSQYVIQYFDSSEWIITSYNKDYIENVCEMMKKDLTILSIETMYSS